MENQTIFLSGLLNEVGRLVADHFIISMIAAIIVLLVAFFRERLFNISAVFAPVKVHGKWSTTLSEPAAGIPSGAPAQTNRHGDKAHEYVKLHQFFNKVWGDAFVQNDANDIYQVSGRLVADKLALIFRDKKGFDTGAVLLRVTHKDLMQGYEIGVDPAGVFYSGVYKWKREADKFATAHSSGH